MLAIAFGSGSCMSVQIRSQRRDQDAHAAQTVRAIVENQRLYHLQKGRYAARLSDLDIPNMQNSNDPQQPVHLRGYCYLLKLSKEGYEVEAWPEIADQSGYRSFYGDNTGLITFTLKWRAAGPNDIELD